MQYNLFLAAVALLATSVAANPTKPSKPQPPPPPPPPSGPGNQQSNTCGNGATPYCCNTDNLGAYTTCSVFGNGAICSATTVCCNANNSIQVCLGNVQIL